MDKYHGKREGIVPEILFVSASVDVQNPQKFQILAILCLSGGACH